VGGITAANSISEIISYGGAPQIVGSTIAKSTDSVKVDGVFGSGGAGGRAVNSGKGGDGVVRITLIHGS
jgi:hypothetical protein